MEEYKRRMEQKGVNTVRLFFSLILPDAHALNSA